MGVLAPELLLLLHPPALAVLVQLRPPALKADPPTLDDLPYSLFHLLVHCEKNRQILKGVIGFYNNPNSYDL